jgi:hypothetical protein
MPRQRKPLSDIQIPLYRKVGKPLTAISLLGLILVVDTQIFLHPPFSLEQLVFKTWAIPLFVQTLIFALSTRIEVLKILHPVLLFFYAGVAVFTDPEGYMGIIYFFTGLVVAERYGFFRQKPKIKFCFLFSFFAILGFTGAMLDHAVISLSADPPFAIACFFAIFYEIFKEALRPVLFHGPDLPVLNLHHYGITHSEYRVIRGLIYEDKTIKEIATDMGVGPSMVRNRLVSIYKKLGIKPSLTSLAKHILRHTVQY